MKQLLRVLIVEDSEIDADLLVRELRRGGYDPAFERVDTAEAMEAAISRSRWDLVVSDYTMPKFSGLAALSLLRAVDPDLPFIIISGVVSEKVAVEAMRAGAQDFMAKDNLSRLVPAITRELESATERQARRAAETARRQAEVRAEFAEALERSNHELESAYRTLRETQSMLVQSAKMASLGSLVAGIAHEVNNPLAFVSVNLSNIRKWVEEIRPELESRLSPEGGEKFGKILSRMEGMALGVDRITELVVKLRTFSRIDESEFKTIDVEDSIESTLTLLKHKLEGRITVIKEYGEVKHLACYAGPLNQVFMNVLSNAIDAIEAEGTIRIKTAGSGQMLRISIRDSGSGIAKELLDRLFEPFFTTKPVGSGTGLGLSISYGIIKRHRGEIQISSEEGTGTEVVISLPIDGPETVPDAIEPIGAT